MIFYIEMHIYTNYETQLFKHFFSFIIGSTVLVYALYSRDSTPSLVFTARATDPDTGLIYSTPPEINRYIFI